MSAAPASKVADPVAEPAEATPGPQSSGPRPSRRTSWVDGLWRNLGERLAASQQALATIRPTTSIWVAAILIVPAALGFSLQAYTGTIHRQVPTGTAGGAIDLPTAMVWWGSDLMIGTHTGKLLKFSPATGAVTQIDEPPGAGPILDLSLDDGGFPIVQTPAGTQLSSTPTAARALQVADSGIDQCLSGFVWREATGSDLTCVTPDRREVSRQIAAEANPPPEICPDGFVKRLATRDDKTCVTPEEAAVVAEENRADQDRKVIPDAARNGTLRLLAHVNGQEVPADRGLLAVAGKLVISGDWSVPADFGGPAGCCLKDRADATTFVLDQQLIEDGKVTKVGELPQLKDVRVLAQQPGTPNVYAGDSEGWLYAFDDSQQISGVNPSSYLQIIGKQGPGIAAIAVASQPAANMPLLAAASDDGGVMVWWPAGTDVAGAALPGSQGVEVTVPGSRWDLAAEGPASDGVETPTGPGRNVLASIVDDDLVTFETAPPGSSARSADLARLAGPISISDDGRRSISYDPTNDRVVVYEGLFRREVLAVPMDHGKPFQALLSPNGDDLAVVESNGSLRLVAMDSAAPLGVPGDVVATASSPATRATVATAAFNPTGNQLALALDNGTVELMRVSDGTQLGDVIQASSGLLAGNTRQVSSSAVQVRYTQNGRQLLFFDPRTGAISTYSIRLQRQSAWRALDTAVTGAKLSGDGRRIVARTEDGSLEVFDALTGTSLARIANASATIWGMSKDAGAIAAANDDGSLQLFLETPDPKSSRPSTVARDGLRLSADGTTVMVRDTTGHIRVWKVGLLPDEPVADTLHFDQAQMHADFGPDLVAVDAELAPDGSFVVAADAFGTVRLLDVDHPGEATVVRHGSVVHRMLLSPDGHLLATASIDGVVQVTDLDRARIVGTWPLYDTPLGPVAPRPVMRTLPDLPAASAQAASADPNASDAAEAARQAQLRKEEEARQAAAAAASKSLEGAFASTGKQGPAKQ